MGAGEGSGESGPGAVASISDALADSQRRPTMTIPIHDFIIFLTMRNGNERLLCGWSEKVKRRTIGMWLSA